MSVLLLAASLLLVAPAGAHELRPAFDRVTWGIRDGLPQATVTGIAPAPDGSLWLSTFAGLARFDGKQATTVGLESEVGRLTRLATIALDEQDPTLLWVSTIERGLWQFDGARFFRPDLPDALQSGVVWSLTHRDGELLVGGNRGLFERDARGVWTQLLAEPIHSAFRAPDGSIWGCGPDGWMGNLDGDSRLTITLPPETGSCNGGMVDEDGDWWLLTVEGLWLVERDGTVHPVRVPFGRSTWNQSVVIDPSGALWFGDRLGAHELGPWREAKAAVLEGRSLVPNSHAVGAPRSWHFGADGALWIGTVGNGLTRLDRLRFARLDHRPSPGSRGAGPVHGADDWLWYTADCRDLHLSTGGQTHLVPVEKHPTQGCVDALWGGVGRAYAATGNTLLAGTAEGLSAVAELTGVGIETVEGHAEGAWVGGADGQLYDYRHGVLQPAHPPLPPQTGQINDLLVRRDGTLAVGHGEGVCLQEGGGWRCLTSDDGLGPGSIRDLAEDDSGRIWCASYGGGLSWIDASGAGQVTVGTRGISDPYLSSVIVGPRGSLWLQGNAGVTRVRFDDLVAHLADPSTRLRTELVEVGEANGFLRHSAALLSDGALWLAGVGGIAALDTTAFEQSEEPGPPVLRAAVLGDTPLNLDASTQAPADAFRRLEVEYGAPTLSRSAAAWYEHRLVSQGDPSPWSSPTDGRSAVYTGLTPGAHRFEVREIGLDGRKGPVASLDLTITPHWWERPWTYPLALVVLLGSVAGLFTLRVREQARRNRSLQAEIDRRAQVERALEEREEQFRQVFNRASNGLLLYDAQGACITANPKACALFGLELEVLRATPRGQLGLPQLDDHSGPEPVLCTRPDGTHFAARIDETQYESRQGPRVLTSIVDLTALSEAQNKERALRTQLAAAQRLEALGRLAGGVAHDMNNVLAVIASNLEMLEGLVVEDSADATDCLSDATAGVERGTAMVRQLLTFSRQHDTETSLVDLAHLLTELERMLRQLVPPDRTLVVTATPVGTVQANATQLEQVVLNLVTNASDAAGPNGHITVRLAEGEQPRTVCLTVEDDGPGIEDDVLEHIFEPFFTTKERGKGTGLGLPTASSIVAQAGGTLTVDTSPSGSCFRVTLPQRAEHSQPVAPVTLDTSGDGRLIVLVDDDSGVRRSVQRQLRRAGWLVEDFEDPLAALEAIQSDRVCPALLVTDVLMPRMNGRQLAKAVTAHLPDLPVLFISGYTADVLGPRGEDSPTLLQKPFSRKALLEAVAKQLHG